MNVSDEIHPMFTDLWPEGNINFQDVHTPTYKAKYVTEWYKDLI